MALVIGTGALGLAALVLERRRWQPPSRLPQPSASPAVGEAALSGVPSIGYLHLDSLAARLRAGRAEIGGLEFVGSSDTLAPSDDVVLARLATALAGLPGAYLVEAHVAASGDAIADQWLTDRRAAAVRARLIAAGVPAARLFSMGFGATRTPKPGSHAPRTRLEVSRMP